MKIGYIRISKHEQNEALQRDALQDAGCEKYFSLRRVVSVLVKICNFRTMRGDMGNDNTAHSVRAKPTIDTNHVRDKNAIGVQSFLRGLNEWQWTITLQLRQAGVRLPRTNSLPGKPPISKYYSPAPSPA